MEGFDWRGLLTRWNQELLRCPRVVASLPDEAVASGWLGHTSATEAEIRAAQVRLGATLPPSYRSFLGFTNGWWTTGRYTGRLWSADKIDWFATRHRDAIDDWLEGERLQGGPYPVPDEEYYVYGDLQKEYTARFEYLNTALQVSEMEESSVYLLNPRVVAADGEWEAWFLAPWIGGAWRYRSFWDLMQAEYELFTC